MAINISENVTFLLHDNIFISVVPGEIIFGVTNNEGFYEENKSFCFYYCDYFQLYKTFVKIMHFFAEDGCYKDLIKQFNDINYYWCGIIAMTNNVEQKSVKLGIEMYNGNCFEIIFNEIQLTNFLYILKNCMVSSLYLSNDILFVFENLYKEKLEVILNFENNGKAFIKKKLKIKTISKINQIFDVITHYLNLVIIVHKLQMFEPKIIAERQKEREELLEFPRNLDI